MGEGGGGLLLDASRARRIDLLPQQRDARAARVAALAGIGRLEARRDPQQRGLADAIGPDQRDPVTGAHLELDAREERPATEGAGDAGEAERHGPGR